MRPRTVFRTSRAVRDAAKLNQLVVRPLELLLEDEQPGEAVIDGEFGEIGGEPVMTYKTMAQSRCLTIDQSLTTSSTQFSSL